MANSILNLLCGLILFLIIILNQHATFGDERIISLAPRADDLKLLGQIRKLAQELILNNTNFYNYSLVCGGSEFDSRFIKEKSFVDLSIPIEYKSFLFSTYMSPYERPNKCPKWSTNNGDDDFRTIKSGGMETLSIPENTRIGQKLYTLSAVDPEGRPIYYFIRKAEIEAEKYPNEAIIFDVNTHRLGTHSWIGEVILNKTLDYETKSSYSYLSYAFDGVNLIEKYNNIEVIDVDDEKPKIYTNNTSYDKEKKQFFFKINENLSINQIINPISSKTNILIDDVDTRLSQLRLSLIFVDTGLADTPFSISNQGEIKIVNNLDYEMQKDFLLKLIVKDTGDNLEECFIHIEVIDMPDMPPKFIKPIDETKQLNEFLASNHWHNIHFYENTIGKVFDLMAISSNKQPLSDIRYELADVEPNEYASYFELKKNENDSLWYLNCLKKFFLDKSANGQQEESVRIKIRAIEESSPDIRLSNEKLINLRILNGDLCRPRFDKEVYEFKVIEKKREFLEPIYVEDCDYGENGEILLETTSPEFTFKLNKVYRESKVGLEMLKIFNYSQGLGKINTFEFEIIARGTNKSINKYETRSKVKIHLTDLNEFSPEFILPPPVYIMKDGVPTREQQRIFTYKVPENEDFSLDVLAVDHDGEGNDGPLFYSIGFLKNDTFKIESHLNSTNKIFNIKIPGIYLDSKSNEPIIFTVTCEDYGEPRLKRDIIIYVRPQTTEFRPLYFEFSKYEFSLKESTYEGPLKIKLINDNLKSSRVVIKEIHDPLNLISMDYDDLNKITMSEQEMTSYRDPRISQFNSLNSEVENELLILLYQTEANRDFDQLYIDNNRNDVYLYKLRAHFKDDPTRYTDLSITIKLIDKNDNKPVCINLPSNQANHISASLKTNFTYNSQLLLENDANYVLKYRDLDFSESFGLQSLFFKINDSRFVIDNEYISNQILENENLNELQVTIKVQALTHQFDINREPVIWLNLTCRDNYFNRRSNRKNFFSTSNLIRVNLKNHLVESRLVGKNSTLFNQDSYLFQVSEQYLGKIGHISTFLNNDPDHQVDFNFQLDFEDSPYLKNYFELHNSNDIYLIKPFDYELGQRLFNFSVIAISKQTNKQLGRAKILVLVNDANDHEPLFTREEYEFDVKIANFPASKEIGRFFITDLDKEDWNNIVVDFDDKNDEDSQKFKIVKLFNGANPRNLLQSFALETTKAIEFDEEKNNQIQLVITATDKAKHKSKANVVINYKPNTQPNKVIHWYDSSDKETFIYKFKINNKNLNDKLLFNVKAKLDIKKTDELKIVEPIRYKLIDNSAKEFFSLNEETGELTKKMTDSSNNPGVANNKNLLEMTKFKSFDLFVQAFCKVEDPFTSAVFTYWSPIVKVEIDIEDEIMEKYLITKPIFVLPSTNNTIVLVNKNQLNGTKERIKIYTFLAINNFFNNGDEIKNQIRYNLIESCLLLDEENVNCSIKFPFVLNKINGTLEMDLASFQIDDYIRLLANNKLHDFTVRIKLSAFSQYSEKTFIYFLVEFRLNHLTDLFIHSRSIDSLDDIPKVSYDLEPNIITPKADLQTEKLLDTPQNTDYDEESKIVIKKLEPEKFEISLNESLIPNTVIFKLSPEIRGFKLDKNHFLADTLKIKSNSDINEFNPESYINYDSSNGNIKLIRKLHSHFVPNISFSLVNADAGTINPLTGETINTTREININLIVKDVNDQPPTLVLNEEEEKNGDNLIAIAIENFDEESVKAFSKVISSTFPPPRKPPVDIPEMNFKVPKFMKGFTVESKELVNNIRLLKEFSRIDLIKSYKIDDLDDQKLNNFTVKFTNDTGKFVIENFLVTSNQTHVLLKRKPIDQILATSSNKKFQELNKNTTSDEEDSDNLSNSAISFNPMTNKFGIELSDGKQKTNFSGEIFDIDEKQLEHFILHAPLNGRYKIEVFKSTIPNIKLDITPPIRIRNIFPVDIYMSLEGDHAKYFHLSSPRIKPIGTISFLPHDVVISLKEPLDKNEEIMFSTRLSFQIRLSSNNTYINKLLESLGVLSVRVDVKNENKFEPKITEISPPEQVIVLDEGFYSRKQIARIKGFDKDSGDQGRLDYFIIGSAVFDIDVNTGIVYLNGTLDAESQPNMTFYCYARDLAPMPFGMSSKMVEFKVHVNDVNEFSPVIQPITHTINIKENDKSMIYSANETKNSSNYIKDLRFECYDRDLNSSLSIILSSVRYVSKYESNKYMDDPNPYESGRYLLKNLFKLVNDIEDNEANYKSAFLSLNSNLNYELLYKPNETQIRVDVTCTDGKYETVSKILINVIDQNDNAPRFVEKNMVIRRNESNRLYNLVQIKAVDMDWSAQYGNESLVYTIEKCMPDLYQIYIDKRTGEISSKLIIDLDTDEINEKRKNIYSLYLKNQELSALELSDKQFQNEIDFMQNFNKITCNISVFDSFGSDVAMNDSMTLTIEIDDVNDNKPEIDSDNELTFEVKEGEATRGLIITKIRVFDKDDARGLDCIFSNGFHQYEVFELKTSMDIIDSYHTAWCILKVQDGSIIDYDINRVSTYLLDIVVLDMKPKPPVYPNNGKTSAQVKINVIKVNKRPPMFLNGDKETFYVFDSLRPESLVSTISATDMDNPNQDHIIYRINPRFSSKSFEKFELRQQQKTTARNWASMGIFTKSKLEVSESPYVLSIIAYDGPIDLKDTLFSQKLISIVVLNKGSMSVWSNAINGLPVDSYSVDLNEESKENTFVLRVQAKLHDSSPENASDNIIYSIEGSRGNDTYNPYFKIDHNTGEIKTTNIPINYEEKDNAKLSLMRNIRVRAATKDNYLNYVTHVSINIIDINDNAPLFVDKMNKLFHIVENQTFTEPKKFGQVFALDADSGDNGLVEYMLSDSNSNEINEAFSVEKSTGDLYLIKPNFIDRELNDTIKLKIIAFDNHGKNNSSFNTSMEIEIIVLDINDNRPQFSNETEKFFEIDENTILFDYKIKATDLDLGNNSTLTFSIDRLLNENNQESLQKFFINSMTGLLTLNSPLDYETKQSYTLFITCSDNGIPERLNSTIKLLINVTDVNDNSPKFSLNKNLTQLAKLYVNESTKFGEHLTRIEAIDLDPTDIYNKTTYSINALFGRYFLNNSLVKFDETKTFEINSDTGDVSFGSYEKLNFSNINEYTIEIKAVDRNKFNDEKFQDFFNLTIIVIPSNNKKPIFEFLSKDGQNQEDLNPITNDTAKVLKLFRRGLSESQPNDYFIDIVKAYDPNQHGIKYYLDSVEDISPNKVGHSVPIGLFKIDEADGLIKACRERSYYSADAYKLDIRAVSKLDDSLSTTMSLIINVDSSVDSLFDSRIYQAEINENCQQNTYVFKLGPKHHSKINLKYDFNRLYSTPTSIYDKWFKLNSRSGEIRTNSNEIDYEKHNETLLSIDVFDEFNNDLIETILVKVNIIDVNDNRPEFDLTYNYQPILDEDNDQTAKDERMLTKFRAFDLDGTFFNSKIEYSIVHVSTKALDKNSFKLVTLEENNNNEIGIYKQAGVNLDRDNKLISNRIEITILANDMALKTMDRLSNEIKIVLTLNDLNDNYPQILSNHVGLIDNRIELKEDSMLNKPFYQIVAHDADEGLNADLVYSIHSEETSDAKNNLLKKTSFFSIDSKSGNLYLVDNIDYELERQVNVTIAVFDKSSQPLTSFKSVEIIIVNVNDNSPVFLNIPFDYEETLRRDVDLNSKDKCLITVYEGPTSKNKFLHQFNATDLDMTKSFQYEIVKLTHKERDLNKNIFRIEKETGKFYVNNIYELDREQIDSYKVVISVKDEPIFGKQLETFQTCVVRVLDINDNAPVFDDKNSNRIEFKILPIIHESTFIHWFGATDADLGNNATIEYSLVDAYANLFKINSKGYLYLNLASEKNAKDLNVHLNDVYDLKILINDMGTPNRLNTSLSTRIRIDPNYFKFSQATNNELDLKVKDIIYLDENTPNKTFVEKVLVMNSYDSIFKPTIINDTNKKISLEFKLLTCQDVFTIDKQTGQIFVLNSNKLDYEKVNEFLIQIEALEKQSMIDLKQQRVGKASILIKLNNVNDNVPKFTKQKYEYSIDENQSKLPTQFNADLSNLIQIEDRDLTGSVLDLVIIDQIDPMHVLLTGPDSASFRLVKIDQSKTNFVLEALVKFDYEQKTNYTFDIVAYDGKYNSSSRIVVKVNDLNDNVPLFDSRIYEFNLDENAPRRTIIGQVHATDKDATPINNVIFYKLLNVNQRPNDPNDNDKYIQVNDIDLFSLNEKNGELKVEDSKVLDREKVLSFNLTVICYNKNDWSNQIDKAFVIVYLNDLNDNAPVFNYPPSLILNIREKSQFLPRLLIDLNAQDPDLAENGTVQFKIESINGQMNKQTSDVKNKNNSDFYLDQFSGQLYLNSYFDLEDVRPIKNYEIVITAYDLGLKVIQSAKMTVFVNILDINDHLPKVLRPQETIFEFDEDANGLIALETLKYLFDMYCDDPDYSRSKINYSMEKDLNDDWTYFDIDSSTGHLHSKFKFDYETKKEFNLKLNCKDSGVMIDLTQQQNSNRKVNKSLSILNDFDYSYPTDLTSSVRFTIKLNDVDDNEPEFSSFNETLVRDIPDNLELKSTVLILPLAHDRDTYKANTNIRYLLLSGNEENKFELNETSGEITLIDELDRKITSLYKLVVKATSKSKIDVTKIDLNNFDDKSLLRVELNIVKDRIFIEFDEETYFISLAVNTTQPSTNKTMKLHKQYKFNDEKNSYEMNSLSLFDTATSVHNNSTKINEVFINKVRNSAIFYSKAHLKQRKLKRSIRFNIELLQLIKADEKISNKLSESLVSTKLNDRSSLFQIDETNGKIFVNKNLLKNYQIGDRFVLSISATDNSMANSNDTEIIVNDKVNENTMTRLTVRLTEKDYSFIMPLTNLNIDDILFNYLNPLRVQYIPRIMEADGVKISIQDLVNKPNISYYLIVQVETKFDHKQIDLDLFVNLWKNYSSSNMYFKELNSFIDKQPVQDARLIDQFDQNDYNKPFYMSWLFWLLFIIGLLLIIILVFFICCIKLTKKQDKLRHHKSNRSGGGGIIIEYPPGVNPIYQDGVLNLNNKLHEPLLLSSKSNANKKVYRVDLDQNMPPNVRNNLHNDTFEEQELQMNIEDDIDDDQLALKC